MQVFNEVNGVENVENNEAVSFSVGEETAQGLGGPIKVKKQPKSFFAKKQLRTNIFVICMLAYPVLQFVVMWAFVNIDSILMTFQKYDAASGGWKWVGFANYKEWIELFKLDLNGQYSMLLVNSVLHSVVGMFIIFPICLIFSYFLCRKVPLSGFFRIVFYLPSIIPLVVLTLGFTNMIKVDGLLGMIVSGDPQLLTPPRVRWTIYLFTIWAGIGGNMLLLSGTIKRVPSEVLESAHLDGVGVFGELFRIVIPMVWPTLVTLFVMSMMGIFSVVYQPLFISGYIPETNTIGLYIFNNATSNSGSARAATLGIMCTIVIAPIILLTRWGLDKVFADVDY